MPGAGIARRRAGDPSLRTRSLLLVGLLAILTSLAPPSPAGAHAVLLSVEPSDGARLDRSPDEIRLDFNEPVAPARVRVLDQSGSEVAGPDRAVAHGTMVHIALPPVLPDGGYVVSYRVVSLDGHPVLGSAVFVIGEGAAAVAPATADRSAALTLAAVTARAVHYLAVFGAAGGALFILLVTGRRHPLSGRFVPAIVAAAVLAVASAVARIGLTGAELIDGTLAGLLQADAWSAGSGASVTTSAGVASAGMAVIGLGLVVLRRPAATVLLALGAAAAIGSLAVSGHAATASPRWLSAPLVVLHGAAAAYWIGAFWPIVVVLRAAPTDEALAIVQRFAGIAIAAVGLLAVAGAGLSVLQIGSLAALAEITDTDYGLLWLAKLVLVMVLLALAAVNRQVLTPALAQAQAAPGAAKRLRRSVAAEAVLAVAIAAVTAGFALGPPPRALPPASAATASAVTAGMVDHSAHGHAGHAGHGGHGGETGRTVSAEVRGRVATISFDPARAGPNGVVVRVMGADGNPLVAQGARIEMALPALGVEPIARELTANGGGTYTLSGTDLPIAGRWSLRLDVLVSDFEKLIFRTELPVGD